MQSSRCNIIIIIIISLSNNDSDDDGSENIAKKLICILSNFIASIWTRSIYQIKATFPGVEFLRTLYRFKKRKENSLWVICSQPP